MKQKQDAIESKVLSQQEDSSLLKVKNLHCSYNKGKKPVIKGAEISLERGTITALLGPNGSGKTTLLKAVGGLLACHADMWEVCKNPVKGMTEKERASYFSYIPQRHSIMYSITVLDTVVMGLNPHLGIFETASKEQKKEAENMLEYMGLQKLVHEDFLSLSGGQKQLVLFTRAMVQNAPVMLFDEPDSGLDYENRQIMFTKIRKVIDKKQYGALLTLHDPDYALRYCDYILLLQEGRIQNKIDCKNANRKEAERKLSSLYPRLRLIEHNGVFFTVK